MEPTYTPEQIKLAFEKMINIACVHLQLSQDAASKLLKDMQKKKDDEVSKEEKLAHSLLYERIAVLLDIIHKSFPVCYDMFPKNHENLDNVYKMHKRFEKSKLMKECECDYCKEHPIKIENIASVKEQKPQEENKSSEQSN